MIDEYGFMVVFGVYILVFIFGMIEMKKQGYKEGQIDYKKGVVKKPYVLIEFKDGERKWMRETEIKQYCKSYTEGYKIVDKLNQNPNP